MKICLASHNPNKLIELNNILEENNLSKKYEFVLASNFFKEEPEETGKTFADNALIKAKNAFDRTKINSLSDDSGFCVESLNWHPGIYSARWVDNNDYNITMQKIYNLMKNSNNSSTKAKFVCCLCLYYKNLKTQNLETEYFVGEIFGNVCFEAKGNNGFGYDPYFIPDGHDQTFAQMPKTLKNSISHRKLALTKLISFLQTMN